MRRGSSGKTRSRASDIREILPSYGDPRLFSRDRRRVICETPGRFAGYASRCQPDIDWGGLLSEVARRLLGDPSSKHSGEWRYGRKGSLKVNLPGTDTSDTLSYTATKADDTTLPTWLGFDATTRTFTGTPAASDVETVSVTVEGGPGYAQCPARRGDTDLRCERRGGHQQFFPSLRFNPSSPATFPARPESCARWPVPSPGAPPSLRVGGPCHLEDWARPAWRRVFSASGP